MRAIEEAEDMLNEAAPGEGGGVGSREAGSEWSTGFTE